MDFQERASGRSDALKTGTCCNPERLHPYLYSQAVRALFTTPAYPWTMTPLPIAYPNEAEAYGRENRTTRGYEWMIGDALPRHHRSMATTTQPPKGAMCSCPQENGWTTKRERLQTARRFSRPTRCRWQIRRCSLEGTGNCLPNKSANGVVARIYPINPKAHTEFWSADSKTKSTVELRVQDWDHLKVMDITTHRTVAWKQVRFAAEFPLVPGHAYLVQ